MNNFFLHLFLCCATVVCSQNRANSQCVPSEKLINKRTMENNTLSHGKNVLGSELQITGTKPVTGYYRDGFCTSGSDDKGIHVIAAVLTTDFLQFSKSMGNDLTTPIPAYGFPGLKANDKWCLCASRWKEAFDAGVAPPVILNATHEKALEFVTLEQLQSVK